MRIKRATSAIKHKRKIRRLSKGYWGANSKQYCSAKQQVMRAGNYRYIGRKQEKRQMRSLWIARINAACRLNDINYSNFMHGLKKANIDLNRKMLAEMAVNDAAGFSVLVATVK